jgi:hypothetical protein
MTIIVGDVATTGRVGLVALTVLVAVAVLHRLRAANPSGRSAYAAAMSRRPTTIEPRPREFDALERAVELAPTKAADLHYRLRPVIRDVTMHRLLRAYGIDLDSDPEHARLVLGDQLFDLVRGDRPPPDDRWGPGIPLTSMDELVRRMEQL